MKITEISKDKKHLSKVVFENGESILLDNDTVDIHCIRVEDDLTEEKVEELIFESDYSRAKSRALWYLERSAHTEKALYDKLIKAGFEEKASAAVIARLIELGFINDRVFAENFAERCAECNISRREAAFKMIRRGVNRDLAYEVLDELDTDEEAQIRALLDKKYRSKLSTEKGPEKVYAALIRKGFSFSTVKNVMKKYIEELEYYV